MTWGELEAHVFHSLFKALISMCDVFVMGTAAVWGAGNWSQSWWGKVIEVRSCQSRTCRDWRWFLHLSSVGVVARSRSKWGLERWKFVWVGGRNTYTISTFMTWDKFKRARRFHLMWNTKRLETWRTMQIQWNLFCNPLVRREFQDHLKSFIGAVWWEEELWYLSKCA